MSSGLGSGHGVPVKSVTLLGPVTSSSGIRTGSVGVYEHGSGSAGESGDLHQHKKRTFVIWK